MDPALATHIDLTMPDFNPKLAEGFAMTQIPLAEWYVDMLFSAISKSFPAAVKYNGGRRCTPMEEYKQATKKRNQKILRKNPKSTFDIARSDVFMNQYEFLWHGKPFANPLYLYLPFVTTGGHITISGSRFTVTPVLSDRVISVLEKSIFVRLIKTRLTIHRLSQHYLLDGNDIAVHVVWSKVYQKPVTKDRTDQNRVTANSTLPHYLFCKYGFAGTFDRFAGGVKPVIGDITTITREFYPEDEWHIMQSVRVIGGEPPPGRSGNYYIPSKLRVAVRKSEFTPMVKTLLGGFFYVLDFFPERIKPEYFDKPNETRMWITLLGHIVAPGSTSEGKLWKEMEDHMRSLDEYIDAIVQTQLAKIGIAVDNVYQLFAFLTERFNSMLLNGAKNLSSMYDKELNVLYFTMYDISKAIVELGFRMMKLSEKPDLTEKEVMAAFTSLVRPGLIYSINKTVGSVTTNSYPGDNMALKITTLLVPQQSSNKKTKGREPTQLSDPINRLHSSVAEIGAYANLPKSAPSGHNRLAHFPEIDEDNVLQRNPKFVELLDNVQRLFELQ
jgi:hypothetical protein